MSRIVVLIVSAFALCPAWAQTERVFSFTNTDKPQDIYEINTLMSAIAQTQVVSTDTVRRTITMRGTPDQLALAQWLFDEMDRPTGAPVREYRVPGTSEDVVRVFYAPHTATLQDFQEVATAARSMADIRRVFTYNAPRAIAMRGTRDQMAMAEWLVNELDRPVNEPRHEFPVPGARDDMLLVVHVPHAAAVTDLQEVATLVRSIGDIRRLFTYSSPRAMALRGTRDQMALAGWLVNELDKPANQPSVAGHEYRMLDAPNPDNVVRVYYLPQTETLQRFQEVVKQIRLATQIRYTFTYNAPRAVAFRGTLDQLGHADRMIRDHNK